MSVYFIRAAVPVNLVKIGVSGSVLTRLRQLQHFSPVALTVEAYIPGDVDEERHLHHRFSSQYSHAEWFRPSHELNAFIIALAHGAKLGDLIDMTGPLPPQIRLPRCRRKQAVSMKIQHAEKAAGVNRTDEASNLMYLWRAAKRADDVPQVESALLKYLADLRSLVAS